MIRVKAWCGSWRSVNAMPLRGALLLAASLPLGASFAVLFFAGVGKHVWLTHVLLIGATCFLVAGGRLLDRWVRGVIAAHAIVLITVVCLAVALWSRSSAPHRWISAGPLNLYIAPLFLPSFLAACSVLIQNKRAANMLSFPALIGAGVLLALQPDASQNLALFAGATLVIIRCRARSAMSITAIAALALATACAFLRPDPLQPVPHVEGVFSLSLDQSLFAGLAVIASAFVWIVFLCVRSLRGPIWLSAVAGYYAVLFCCAAVGLTPAPLIGFGAGPLLGYGLMTSVSVWMGSEALHGASPKSMRTFINEKPSRLGS